MIQALSFKQTPISRKLQEQDILNNPWNNFKLIQFGLNITCYIHRLGFIDIHIEMR